MNNEEIKCKLCGDIKKVMIHRLDRGAPPTLEDCPRCSKHIPKEQQEEKSCNIFMPKPTERDFPEEYYTENGCYEHVCCSCNKIFYGNKHRVVCKVCETKPKQQKPEWEKLEADLDYFRDDKNICGKLYVLADFHNDNAEGISQLMQRVKALEGDK